MLGHPPSAFITAKNLMIGESSDDPVEEQVRLIAVSYTHLRAHETVLDLVCRLLLEKKNTKTKKKKIKKKTKRDQYRQ